MAVLVRMTEQFQTTLPVALRKTMALETSDYLPASRWADSILLRPESPRKSAPVLPGMVEFPPQVGRLGRSRKDMGPHVNSERAAWDR